MDPLLGKRVFISTHKTIKQSHINFWFKTTEKTSLIIQDNAYDTSSGGKTGSNPANRAFLVYNFLGWYSARLFKRGVYTKNKVRIFSLHNLCRNHSRFCIDERYGLQFLTRGWDLSWFQMKNYLFFKQRYLGNDASFYVV